MLKTRQDVARRIGRELIELEREVDGALVRQASLQVALIEGRRAAKLPLDAGQHGLVKIGEAVASLLAARAAIHDAHHDFRAVRDAMGVRADYGDYGDTPNGYQAEVPVLALVPDAAAA